MSHRKIVCIALFVSLLSAVPASADIVMRESDIHDLRLGQHVYIDDGSCPAGQIKEVTGVKLTAAGVARVRKCADRKTMRR
ncbi:DUF6719 family protein [Bradyrhizobium sp. SYSU BS000235]|uniref:DUF6719 family protein n=1 Tax=Bradyrhizobium sp. SYSU BS000235 TaxID=3411332 RepID=UPI003C76E270